MNQSALHQLLSSTSARGIEKDPVKAFERRLATNLTLINSLFFSIYPETYSGAFFLELLNLMPKLFAKRSNDLRLQDLERLEEVSWYQSEKIVGMQLYVDHFNTDLKGLEKRLDYLDRLGINFIHLMPLTTRPDGPNDGGYAVNSYTEIDPKFGSREDFLELTKIMRSRKMLLMLDFVLNHTSDEFEWAKKALNGQHKYQEYYYTYPDRTVPDAFETSLPEVFPETSPGNFTYRREMDRWVMTVFNSYQWDLNYKNPEVFLEMLTKLMELVDMGVDVVRFDALAFLWKKQGTNSQNLPETHLLITLFRMCLQVMAPGVVVLAEAIVSPYEILKYFGEDNRRGNECEIAYNANFMALLWNSIATTKTNLLYHNLLTLPSKPREVTWVNYIRCHDDIGLGFDDGLIRDMGWDPWQHRGFLLDYYCRGLPWSPAIGVEFMHNPKTGDGRIAGSTASLLGLEKALINQDENLLRASIDKIILMHAIILSCGGIPVVYGGDELATLNDYSYLKDVDKREDSRWVNRPKMDWRLVDLLDTEASPASVVYTRLKHLIGLRKVTPEFADRNNFVPHQTGNPHLLVFERPGDKGDGILVLCNFDGERQVLNYDRFAQFGYAGNREFVDLVSNEIFTLESGLLQLQPYQVIWVRRS